MNGSFVNRAFAFAAAAPLVLTTGSALAAQFEVDAADSAMAVDAAFVGGITGTGDFLDGPYNEPAAGNQQAVNLGRFNGREQRPIFTFQLPTLPVGEDVLSAVDFAFSTSFDRSNPAFNGDIEAIGVRSSGAIQASDYQAAGTLIEDNALFQGINDFSRFSLSTGGQAALLTYLEANYVAGDFLFLRFTNDGAPPEGDYYALFADTAAATPTLSLTTIPEPASLTLMAAGLALIAGRRRR